MFGFLNLNKPPDWTSHDCVAKVRKILKTKRVGHGGTLDPMATGVLPIAVGSATRLLPYLPENKAYRAKIQLGLSTDTDDITGKAIATCPCADLTLEAVKPHLAEFIGNIAQIPPMYSAIQKDGRRLYELARKGEIIAVEPRQVKIDQITVLGWLEGEFPQIELDIHCGSGTYIRSLARDLGKVLAVGGTLAGLTRTESCGFQLADSINLEALMANSEGLISPRIALAHLDWISLTSERVIDWFHGRKINLTDANVIISSLVAVESLEAQFLGIGEIVVAEDEYYLQPKIVIQQ
ncbi:tRNA pseudouridine(55) synthase TruB [Microcystis aeruginosa NIES-298]|uniref:tRNA pseudouridine synthase B n=1 Tax=Microcystis aeruginosa NIES-298 TaxID=449468 RepID=A0A2H6BWE2_MICAE|nr:tRNA pseudouridine(55) synthase TruB [Microcystis aeruginosa]QHU84159.1 tRNA pseudouridine(55) synthase TruB [Microcystis aeruginosa NIES-298]GBD54486.1 tRNA pseudouridine synthase B [Microcystis aeruginosa NIES-298]GBE96877.1 tRNA pseudouridine(55) synthase TruB [Microcystis aeruginosa NIES-298]